MSDLFSLHDDPPRAPVAPKVSVAPTIEVVGDTLSDAWDRCPGGRWATLHFPVAGGGLRRCVPCAVAEGRFQPAGVAP